MKSTDTLTGTVDLRLDVEGIKLGMIKVFRDKSLDMENAIKKACDDFLETNELQQTVDRAFRDCVQEQVATYFKYGEGRSTIEEAVKKGCARMLTKKIRKPKR